MASADLHALGLSPEELNMLSRYSFDYTSFVKLRAELAAGRFHAERNRVQDPIAPLQPGDVRPWPTGAEGKACATAGLEALAEGKAAVAILNGGMATRFGGRVKGVVEVIDNLSFLALKLRGIARVGKNIPIFIMNSFATERDTRAHFEANNWFGHDQANVHFITQNISMRLTGAGELFRDQSGKVSFYAPGHGDLLGALAGSAGFSQFVERGGQLVAVSNVDNLAATLEPKVLGAHLRAGQAVTVEVAPKAQGDAGGAPVRRAGRVEVLEGFRFPKSFDMEQIPVFNTNTFVLSVAAVRPDYDLTWFRADKEVEGKKVVQFERLIGEVTSFVASTYLEVPRSGAEGRFLPVKTPQDIDNVRPVVRTLFGL